MHRLSAASTLVLCLLLVITPPAFSQVGWFSQTSNTTMHLHEVDFVDAEEGWIAGSSGTLLHTTNGGELWSAQTSDTSYDLLGISFGDSERGTAVGQGGTILRTANGGADWIVVRTDFIDTFRDVKMLNAQVGYAVGTNGIFQPFFAKTTNGGVSWSFGSFYIQKNEGGLYGIDLMSANEAFAAAILWDGRGAVVRTTDGGTTWQAPYVGPFPLLAIDIASPDRIVAAAANGFTVRSTNGGSNWSVVGTGTGQTLHDVTFPEPEIGSVAGELGAIARSNDGGSAWEIQTSGTTEILRGIDFVNEMVGTTVGDNGTILRTVTGGMAGSAVDGRPAGADGLLLELHPSAPNPFRTTTHLRYQTAGATEVRLVLTDAAGRRVRAFPWQRGMPGEHVRVWDGTDESGSVISSGVYYCRLEARSLEGSSLRASVLTFLGR